MHVNAKLQLLQAAAGSSTPYEILTGDMREVNDRALRVVLNEFRRRLEQLQFGVFRRSEGYDPDTSALAFA